MKARLLAVGLALLSFVGPTMGRADTCPAPFISYPLTDAARPAGSSELQTTINDASFVTTSIENSGANLITLPVSSDGFTKHAYWSENLIFGGSTPNVNQFPSFSHVNRLGWAVGSARDAVLDRVPEIDLASHDSTIVLAFSRAQFLSPHSFKGVVVATDVFPGALGTRGFGMNSDNPGSFNSAATYFTGTLVGAFLEPVGGAVSKAHAYLRSNDGSHVRLFQDASTDESYAYSINDARQVVGMRNHRGFLMQPDGTTMYFDAPGAPYETFARAINDVGDVVGFYLENNVGTPGAAHGFWTTTAKLAQLEAGSIAGAAAFTILDVPKQPNTYIRGINNAGQIVGNAGVPDGTNTLVPFVTSIASCKPGAATPASLAIVNGDNQVASFSSDPTSTLFALPLTVAVKDALGVGIAGVNVTFGVQSGGGALSWTNAWSGPGGTAVTYLSGSATQGPITVTALVTGLAPVTFNLLSVQGPVTVSLVSGNSQTAPVGTTLPRPLVVKATTADGKALAGVPVTFVDNCVNCAHGAFETPSIALTDANGIASTAMTLGNVPGGYDASAFVADPSHFVTFSEVGTAASMSLQYVSGNSQLGSAGSVLSQPLVVKVTTASGEPVPDVQVAFAPSSSSIKIQSFGVVYTGPDGKASAAVTLGSTAGSFTVRAWNPGLTSDFFFDFFVCDPTLPPPQLTSGNPISGWGPDAPLSSGSWYELHGTNLASNPRQWQGSDFTGANAPTSLDGTSVSINGKRAFVEYISSTQINIQAPADSITTSGPINVTVTTCGGTSAPIQATEAALAPRLLAPPQFNVGGKQYLAALFADNVTYVGITGLIAGVPFRPAKPGETIILYGVGFGDVTPSTPPGTIAAVQNQLKNDYSLKFSSTSATLSYAGLAVGAVGLYQFNVVVPNIQDGDYPIDMSVGGVHLTGSVYLTVHR